jgi:apolipoprotein N-acyltransferase
MLLALPWTLAWTPSSRVGYLWRVPLANLAFVVPPLAVIGFIAPISSAGYLFPGAGWTGLAATAFLPGLILSLGRHTSGAARTPLAVAVMAVIALSVAAQVSAPARIPPPAGWEAIDTNFGDLSQPVQEFLAMQQIQQRVTTSSARVLIFPESVVPRWSESTSEFWRQTLTECRTRGQVLAIGAGLPSSNSTDRRVDEARVRQYDFASAIEMLRAGARHLPPPQIGSRAADDAQTDSYENTLLFLGAQTSVLYQRVPVPVGMWHPLGRGGPPVHLNGPAVIEIGRKRLAVLICYEQILAYPVLASMLHRPTILVGISSMYWFSGTTIPRYQASAIRAWAKLFDVPYLTATNF